MNTSRSFATISYNTKEFLDIKLNELVSVGFLDFYAYIYHYAENDEGKNHFHLYLQPAKHINTNDFRKFMEEIDLTDITLPPLGCMICYPSKFDDWCLYGLHDKDYLISKGQEREYEYDYNAICTSDKDFLLHLYNLIDRSKLMNIKKIRNAVESGIKFESLVADGAVPVHLINQYSKAYQAIFDLIYRDGGERVFRNGRNTHSPKTGRV